MKDKIAMKVCDILEIPENKIYKLIKISENEIIKSITRYDFYLEAY